MYVCMSFIFRKSFTRYVNSHVTNIKKHSNRIAMYMDERKFDSNKNTIKHSTVRLQSKFQVYNLYYLQNLVVIYNIYYSTDYKFDSR